MPSFYTSSGRLALPLIVALLLVYPACVHGHRSCGLGKFCRIGVDCSNGCVETCRPTSTHRHVQGNWTTGSCEPVPDEVQYWMDSTLYEIFISPTVTGEFKTLGFIVSEEFQRHDDNGDDITFHLYPSDNPYFHFGNSDSIHVALNKFYVPNVIETYSLSSATSDPIPLDDYELQVAVSMEGTEILRRDIIIHVVDPLSSLPPPVTAVDFSSSALSVSESSGSLVVSLVLSGQTQSQSQSFSVIVIAEANSSLSPAATAGMDFTPGRYTATFTMGATTATASIPIVADDIDEPTEQFSLRLYIDGAGYGMGLQQGANKAAIVNILLSEKFKSSYGDRYVLPNGGRNDGKYIYPYVLQKTLMRRATVYNEPDYVSEQKIMEFRKERTRRASLEVILNKSAYRINERDGPVQPVLTLSNPSSTDITVQVRDTANTATGGGVDYESGPYTVTFTAGQTSASFSVPINNDNILEDDEDFALTIVLSTLPDGVTHGARSAATVIIVDDDAITISFNQSTYSVDEDAGTVQLVLVLSNPSSTDFIVQVSDTQNTATRGVDYGFGPYIATFFAGETIASFSILINDNSIFETNETFSLTIDPNSLPTDVTGGSHGIATVTIMDDDTKITTQPSDVTVCAGEVAVFTCVVDRNGTYITSDDVMWQQIRVGGGISTLSIFSYKTIFITITTTISGDILTSTLAITGVTDSSVLGTSLYRCVVNDMMSRSASIHVSSGPSGMPMNIRFSDITNTSFVVQWDEVDDADWYSVNWRDDGGSVRESTTSLKSITITRLTPNTTYVVYVGVINACGSGKNSSIKSVTTNMSGYLLLPSSVSTSLSVLTTPITMFSTMATMPIATVDSSSLSTGVAVAMTFTITFIITLTVSVVITFLVTFVIVKRKLEKIYKTTHQPTQQVPLYDTVITPAITKSDIKLEANPAYGTSDRVAMNDNPAYQSCK